MHILKLVPAIIISFSLCCGSGGPLTPIESFNSIKSAVEKNDSEAVAGNLSKASLEKISALNKIISQMDSRQLSMLALKFGYSSEKLRNLRPSDAAALYFFSDTTGVMLGRYFRERIVSVDINGHLAAVRTESGIILDFVREGPYWKFDLSSL